MRGERQPGDKLVRTNALHEGNSQRLLHCRAVRERDLDLRFAAIGGQAKAVFVNRSLFHVWREVVAVAEHQLENRSYRPGNPFNSYSGADAPISSR